MNIKNLLLLKVLICALLNLTGCSEQTATSHAKNISKEAAMPQTITISLGETGAAFAKRANVKVTQQPIPIAFYEMHWSTKEPALINVDLGSNSFKIPFAIGLQTGSGHDDPMTSHFDINAGVTETDEIMHADALKATYDIIAKIKAAGFKRFISLYDPRLKGKAALDYSIERSGIYGLDSDYVPTLEEWMKLEDGSRWKFEANGIYVTLSFRRDGDKLDVTKPGAYLLSYELQTEAMHYFHEFESEDRKKWKEDATTWVTHWPAKHKQLNDNRKMMEAKLKAQGIPIDESYQDPPLVSTK